MLFVVLQLQLLCSAGCISPSAITWQSSELVTVALARCLWQPSPLRPRTRLPRQACLARLLCNQTCAGADRAHIDSSRSLCACARPCRHAHPHAPAMPSTSPAGEWLQALLKMMKRRQQMCWALTKCNFCCMAEASRLEIAIAREK